MRDAAVSVLERVVRDPHPAVLSIRADRRGFGVDTVQTPQARLFDIDAEVRTEQGETVSFGDARSGEFQIVVAAGERRSGCLDRICITVAAGTPRIKFSASSF